MAGRNAVTWKRDPSQGPTLSFKAPLSLDTIIYLLNRTLFKPASLLLLPLLAYAAEVRKGRLPPPEQAGISLARLNGFASSASHLVTVLGHIRSATTGADATPWLRRLFLLILVLNVHRVLTRYVKNHGHYARDPADFRRDVVVITGGSAGIGRAVVELLSHKHRAKIAVLDMAPPTYAPAPAGAPEILYIKTDVADKDAVARAAELIRTTFGADPAILINNAGIVDGMTILGSKMDHVSRVMRVNTLAHYVTVQQFLPPMIHRGHGHIVSVASSASYMALPQLSAYAVSKAGALAFHESLFGELRVRYGPNARRIRTTVACPTKVRTALGDGLEDQSNQFLSPTLEPIQVALRIVEALEKGLSAHIIMPTIMNLLPVVSRGPAWLRRLLELVGDTDNNVTDAGLRRTVANGYGANFEGEDKALWEHAKEAIGSKAT